MGIMKNMAIVKQLENMKKKLHDSNRLIAQYIIENPERVGYLTATALSRILGISSSTVVRFTQQLGFKGFTEFKRRLLKEMGLVTPFDLLLDYVKTHSKEKDEWVDEIFEKEIEIIKRTRTNLDMKSFNKIITLIENAPRVVITAASIAKVLADRLAIILRCVKIPAYPVEASELYLLRQTLIGSKDDLYIVVGLEKAPREVIKIVNWLKRQGLKVVAIADEQNFRLAQSANYILSVVSERIGGFYSVAPFSTLFTIIAIGFAIRARGKTLEPTDLEEKYKVWRKLV